MGVDGTGMDEGAGDSSFRRFAVGPDVGEGVGSVLLGGLGDATDDGFAGVPFTTYDEVVFRVVVVVVVVVVAAAWGVLLALADLCDRR